MVLPASLSSNNMVDLAAHPSTCITQQASGLAAGFAEYKAKSLGRLGGP